MYVRAWNNDVFVCFGRGSMVAGTLDFTVRTDEQARLVLWRRYVTCCRLIVTGNYGGVYCLIARWVIVLGKLLF